MTGEDRLRPHPPGLPEVLSPDEMAKARKLKQWVIVYP